MSIGYTRAVLDQTTLAEQGPIRFVAATEGRKADGIDLRMAGADLDRFEANPVVLFGHTYSGRDALPIGKATNVAIKDSALVMDVVFDSADDFAQRVERKYRDGFLHAVSIGFDVTEWEGRNHSHLGGVASRWELLEVSAVSVPMDPAAVVKSGRALHTDINTLARGYLLRSLLHVLIDELGHEAASTPIASGWEELQPSHSPEITAAPGLDPDAARCLLAAFDTRGEH